MNISYLLPRAIRHFMPEKAVRFMLRRGLVIRPGLETTDPGAAVQRYLEVLQQEGVEVAGARALVFGYGGSYAVGCGLLEAQAGHAYLCDPYAPPDDRRNQALWPRYQAYLQKEDGRISARPEVMTLISADIRRRRVQEIAEGQAYMNALKTHFGIELDAPYEALRPLPQADLSRKFGEVFPECG